MVGVRSQPTLGDYLVREGIISQAQLNKALEEQLNTSRSIGRILVDRGVITESVRMTLLQKRFGFELERLKDAVIEPLLLLLIPFAFAEKHRVVPIRKEEDGTLVVAMEDPSDIMVLDAMKSQLSMRLKPVIASNEDMEGVLSLYSRQQTTQIEQAEAEEARKPRIVKFLRLSLFPILMVLPLVLFFGALYNDTFGIQDTIGDITTWDLVLYIALVWGTWTIVMFEITGLIFNPKRKEENDEDE